MRPGRLDRILYVSPPDLASRSEIFRVNFKKMAINDDVDIEELAKMVSFASTLLRLLCEWISDNAYGVS